MRFHDGGCTPEELADADAAAPLALSQPSPPEEDAEPDALVPPADPLAEDDPEAPDEDDPDAPEDEDPEAPLELEPSADAEPDALEPPEEAEPEELAADDDAYPDAELAPARTIGLNQPGLKRAVIRLIPINQIS